MDLRPKFGFSCLKKTKIGQIDQKPPKHVFWSIYYHGTTSGAKIRSLIPLCWNIDQIWKNVSGKSKICWNPCLLQTDRSQSSGGVGRSYLVRLAINWWVWWEWQKKHEKTMSEPKERSVWSKTTSWMFWPSKKFPYESSPTKLSWISGQKIKTMHRTLA